eukprot:2197447-Prymnesium_polylepis.2
MWGVCKSEPLVKEGASEEEPEVRQMHAEGKYCICWDPLDGSAIVDNNWAVGTIIGIWPASTGILGAMGRDQVAAMVANYGPRTTAFVTLDDGVYEFTLGVGGRDGWLCSRERVQIKKQSKIFSPANLRTARHELPGVSCAWTLELTRQPGLDAETGEMERRTARCSPEREMRT